MISIKFTNTHPYKGESYFSFFLQPLLKVIESANCPVKILEDNENTVPDIELFGVSGERKHLTDSKAKYKIFFTGENVSSSNILDRLKQYDDNCLADVTLSMGFDFYQEDNYLRFPLWLLYFFRPDDSKDIIRAKLAKFGIVNKKEKFCALIARHDATKWKTHTSPNILIPGNSNNLRTEIYNAVSQLGRVDCPSVFLHNDNSLKTQFADNKIEYLKQYKFNICPENSRSSGYVTEKIFEALAAGCIPIYNGYSRDPEPGIINPKIILWFEYGENNSEVLKCIQQLQRDERKYTDFIKQGFFVDTAVDKISAYLSAFCGRMEKIAQDCLDSSEKHRHRLQILF